MVYCKSKNTRTGIITYRDIGGGVFVCRDSLHLGRQQYFAERVYLLCSCVAMDFKCLKRVLLLRRTTINIKLHV